MNHQRLDHCCILFACFVISCIFSCKPDSREAIPDVSGIHPVVKVVRFDKMVFEMDSSNMLQKLDTLRREHPAFCDLYFKQILQLPYDSSAQDPAFLLGLRQFIQDPQVRNCIQKVSGAFSDFSPIEDQLKRSLQFFKYYFPEFAEPVFYTLVSDFAYANFIFEEEKGKDALGIGLEFFLGSAMDYKSLDPENPAFSEYLSRSFNKDHLVSKTWDAWLEDRVPLAPSQQLLDYIVQRGKKIYLLTKLLPSTPDTVLFEMTGAQLNWCRKNRLDIWSYFLSNNLLYSSQLLKINKYINPSPHSPGMPDEAPGRTGAFIGYEIIKSYMDQNPGIRPVDLLIPGESQQVLERARFKPRND